MKEIYHEPKIQSTIFSDEFNLTSEDIKSRAASFVNERALRLGGIRRLSEDEANQVLCVSTPRKDISYHGLAIPYLNIWNGLSPLMYEVRRDEPEKERNGAGDLKEKRKYMKPPGAKNLLYIPPMVKAEWLKKRERKTIVITEGAFKALALARAASDDFTSEDWHFIPLALSGVENFKTKRNETTAHGEKITVSAGLFEFDRIEWKGATVLIAFDSDASEKQAVKSALWRFTNFLREKKAKVFHLNFPKEFEGVSTKGVDDYLGAVEAKHGTENAVSALLELIEKSQEKKKPTSPVAANFSLVEAGEGDAPGVYFTDDNGERSFICSPLEIVAETQTEQGTNYGKLLKWKDTKNRAHQWAMPEKLIHTEGNEILQRLSDEGLKITPNRKVYERLRAYIAFSQPERTIICTEKIGWHGASAFVLPNETFGGTDEIIYQSANEGFHKFHTKGKLEDWQKNVSQFCSDNSRLAFAVSAAFACPLLPIVDLPGGGFHFRGVTSIGKTTVLLVAGSVFGGSSDAHGYCQTWKATANGLESVAESHNHCLLALDEVSECDGRQVGEIAYMLANGAGKSRMARNVAARRSLTWSLLFLSSGEQKLSDKMRESGQFIKGGQEIRLCDIEADTGRHGLFENLCGFAGGQEFSDHLRRSSKEFYGTPIRAFLDWLVNAEIEAIRKNWRDYQQKFISDVLPESGTIPPEVYRVASRFALVALAGELATESGVTGWTHGAATKATAAIFANWFENREGAGSSDAENAIRQVRHFIELHGQSRFQDAAFLDSTVSNRAGFRRKNSVTQEPEFLIFPEVFRTEVCRGYDAKFIAHQLAERGYLIQSSDGKNTRNERIDGRQQRFFVINGNIFEADETANEASA